MKSAEQNIIDFLKENPTQWASGDLQRHGFKNRNGSLANPRTIVRRLEENTYWETDTPQHKKNLNGVLLATYGKHTTWYQIRSEHKKKVQHVDFILKDGIRTARITYA